VTPAPRLVAKLGGEFEAAESMGRPPEYEERADLPEIPSARRRLILRTASALLLRLNAKR